MAKLVRVLCTESRMVGADTYAEGEEYTMDAVRAAKYHTYFEAVPDVPKPAKETPVVEEHSAEVVATLGRDR